MRTFIITAWFVQVLRWLVAAQSKKLEQLAVIHLAQTVQAVLVSTNGWQMHLYKPRDDDVINTADAQQLAPNDNLTTWVAQKIGQQLGTWVHQVSDDKAYPDFSQVLPKPSDQVACFTINPALLISTLRNFPRSDLTYGLTIRVHRRDGASSESFITIENHDDTALALLMGLAGGPVDTSPRSFLSWAPEKPKAPAEAAQAAQAESVPHV